ncbi:MAG TPA: DUF2087 domain-containing protein [Ktedonobacteraceae bacterium]|nr:DUF2087 domain-containing protein [Ktedonobacteraceae bacterium]
MPEEEYELLLRFCKVLSDSNRLKLLGMLANREYSADELADLLRLKAPVVLRHLAALRELGVVSIRSEDNRRLYGYDGEALQRQSRECLAAHRAASIVEYAEGDAWERKVISDYFTGDRLKDIPADNKKRTVILQWFAGLFEPGVRYKESEVNEIIKRHYPDWAYFRRTLVDIGLMSRDHGIYWRTSPVVKDESLTTV